MLKQLTKSSSYCITLGYYLFKIKSKTNLLIAKHKKGAGFRHTPHGSPQTTTVYGKTCTDYGTSPNNSCLLISCGDCEAIEQIKSRARKRHDTKIMLFYKRANRL